MEFPEAAVHLSEESVPDLRMVKLESCQVRGGSFNGSGDLLDQSLGSDESIVLAGELLDELLVLVELLQVISRRLFFLPS
jgi:hypothetical protein